MQGLIMLVQEFTLENASKLNRLLHRRFIELCGSERVRQTHHFAGRFENTYVDKGDIPDIAELLDVVKQQAGQILDMPPDQLKMGFWFNAMESGHITAPHHHDENGELLSACYYIRVPENSGDLLLHDGDERIRLEPKEGLLVMFKPEVMHEVTENYSHEMRLSIAFNLGPVD